MRYLSICSGIEAFSVAVKDLPYEPAAFSEIAPFPSAVLKERFPDVPNVGDFTKIGRDDFGTIDLIVGGTPCQDFSVAGQREGLDGDRGNLTMEYIRLLDELCPRWFIWENVPGVLSIDKGRTFGRVLKEMVKCGYGVAYRVLDAQYFGVPQRRRRVFVVGYRGDWRRAGAVLFERDCMSGHPAPGGKKRKDSAEKLRGHTLEYYENHAQDSRVTGPHQVTATVSANYGAGGGNVPIVVMSHGQANAEIRSDGQRPSLTCNHEVPIMIGNRPRRLTPKECERLQGFPGDWTKIPWRGKTAEGCPDAPRYCAIGNSMAVPVMSWIAKRILAVDELRAREGAEKDED